MGLGREVPVSLQRRRGTVVKQGCLSARPSKLNNDLSGEGHSVTHVSRHHLVYRQGMAIRVSGVEGGEVCGLGWGVHQVGVGVFHNNDHNDHTPCAAWKRFDTMSPEQTQTAIYNLHSCLKWTKNVPWLGEQLYACSLHGGLAVNLAGCLRHWCAALLDRNWKYKQTETFNTEMWSTKKGSIVARVFSLWFGEMRGVPERTAENKSTEKFMVCQARNPRKKKRIFFSS